jgi:polysaccharide export outer membrane protein
MEKRLFFPFCIIFLSVITLINTSCVNTKKVTYFNNLTDTVVSTHADGIDPIIQKGDLLSISVSSLSPEVTNIFNAPNTPSSTGYVPANSLSQAVGYLVSQEGFIDFPMLGRLKAAGSGKEALKDTIEKELVDKKLLFDPIVTVRYLNFHVTVLGEVNRPGLVIIPNEQGTLLEAIGMAGDLTIYGKRDNVLLLRKEEGKQIVRRLDLNSKEILTSPYYYLKSNDVIYVQPDNNKVASVSQSRFLAPVILAALSFVVVILDHVLK